jgi:hypothetical protein
MLENASDKKATTAADLLNVDGIFCIPDVPEHKLPPEVLQVLLFDHSTNKNIIWATKDYTTRGPGFGETDQILPDQIINSNDPVIRPRVQKTAAEQRQRATQRAEVFTPSWVCNAQNNLVDAAWFNRKTSPFNKESFDRKLGRHTWTPTPSPITCFPSGKSWTDYLWAPRLEVTCGEAPYLTSRYDAVTGEYIKPDNRIGLLDRKLRLVSENCHEYEQWLAMAKLALQSVYAFDWQGDNVLLARENLLAAVVEAFLAKFPEKREFPIQTLRKLAEIISWNVWQMDGIKFIVPYSCDKAKGQPQYQEFAFGDESPAAEENNCPGCKTGDPTKHIGTRCHIMNWRDNHEETFLPPSPTLQGGLLK